MQLLTECKFKDFKTNWNAIQKGAIFQNISQEEADNEDNQEIPGKFDVQK